MPSKTLFVVLASLTLGLTDSIAAAPPSAQHPWCGTGPTTSAIAYARHQAFQRHLDRRRQDGVLPLKSAPSIYQSGNIAVIDDDGSILIPPRIFDLQGKAMQFLRRPKGVSAVRSALGFKQLIGDKIALGDRDSVRVDFPEGFTFPIGERVYTSVWVNSDGSLTFGSPDPFTFISLGTFVAGPPRLAPLYTDLDPSAATGDNGVYVSFPPNRVRVTWLGVPEAGAENLNTFQVTLFETGRVNFAYGEDVDAEEPIVGIAPFEDFELHLMDYNEELPFRPQRTAIAEQFTDDEEFDDFAIGQTFLQHFRDEYTFLISFLDYRFFLSGNAFAFEITVNNNSQGIGEGLFNTSSAIGSDGTLESYIQMGELDKYPDDPDSIFLRTSSAMGVLAHEVGHRWLAKPRFVDAAGQVSLELLRTNRSHWSYFVDADGSVMDGNDWVDQGDGTFRSTDRATSHYSDLDQYLMGLIRPGQVEDFFYIDNPSGGSPDDATAVGAERSGDRVDVTINDIIAATGRRIPTSNTAPKSFRMAFVLVGRPGEPVPQESIDKLEVLRRRWVDFFQEATDFRAEAKTALLPR